MNGNQKDDYVSTASDDVVFSEAAKRLKKIYFNRTEIPFESGSFEFMFQNGRFVCIKEYSQRPVYEAPLWPRPVPA